MWALCFLPNNGNPLRLERWPHERSKGYQLACFTILGQKESIEWIPWQNAEAPTITTRIKSVLNGGNRWTISPAKTVCFTHRTRVTKPSQVEYPNIYTTVNQCCEDARYTKCDLVDSVYNPFWTSRFGDPSYPIPCTVMFSLTRHSISIFVYYLVCIF